jgi:5'-3' exonuclease
LELFRKTWGLEPAQWADVKAYAGCSTDDVPGVPRVGEHTAAKYLRGELGTHTKTYAALARAEIQCAFNLKIVRLPFPGTPTFEIRQDTVTEEKWQALADALGMQSIRDTMPRMITHRKSKGRKRDGKRKGFFE